MRFGYPVVYSVVCILLHLFNGFTNFRNDFPGILFFSDRINLTEFSGLYNGFYPFAYPLLLSFFPSGLNQEFALVLNCIAAGLLLSLLDLLLRPYFNSLTRLLILVATSLTPWFHQYVFSAGPDPLAALLYTFGLFKISNKKFLFAGLLLGFAALFRHHYVALGLLTLVFSTPAKSLPKSLSAFIGIGLTQLLVSYSATGNPFASEQYFNLLKIFQQPNWQDLSAPGQSLEVDASPLLLPYLKALPYLLCFIPLYFVKSRQIRSLTSAVLIYLLLFVPFRSESIWLPVIGVLLASIALLNKYAYSKRIPDYSIQLLLVIVALASAVQNFGFHRSIKSRHKIEKQLADVSSGQDEIYTQIAGIRNSDGIVIQYIHGGWARLTNSDFNESFPPLHFDLKPVLLAKECDSLRIDVIITEDLLLDTNHFSLEEEGYFQRRSGKIIPVYIYRRGE